MRIYADGRDVSDFIGNIGWSGDVSQMARKLSFDYLYTDISNDVELVEISVGSRIYVENEMAAGIFDGIVIDEEYEEADIKKSIQAADYAFYLKSKVYGAFKGTPKQIASQVLAQFGISAGTLLDVQDSVEILATGDKTIYQIITEAYGNVEEGIHIFMTGIFLNVEKIGSIQVGPVSGDDFVTGARYKSSMENMINRVAVIDNNSSLIKVIDRAEDFKYGIVQEVYKHSDDKKNPIDEAMKMFRTIENSGSITCKGDFMFMAGRAVIVEKVNSKIQGVFNITSDSHTISNGLHTVSLTLDFKGVIG